MTLVQQSIALVDALQNWVQSFQGKAAVASNVLNMWELAYQTTDGLKLILCFVGERIRGDFSVAAANHRVDRTWVVAVVRGRGFNATRGDSLNQIIQNAAPFYTQVEMARDLIRTLQNISVELPVDYLGIRPMEHMEQGPLDGYLIDFSTAVDLPQLAAEPTVLADPTPVSMVTLNATLPCLAEPSGGHCVCAASDSMSAVLQGPDGYSFDITLRITGQVEPKVYTGGETSDFSPWFLIGGTPAATTFNIYKIEVLRADASTDTYYLNRSHEGEQSINNIDYNITIPADVGSQITLTAISVNNDEFDNSGLGQWVRAEFVSSGVVS